MKVWRGRRGEYKRTSKTKRLGYELLEFTDRGAYRSYATVRSKWIVDVTWCIVIESERV